MDCAICLEAIEDEDEYEILPCKHSFHILCYERLLHHGYEECPLCRTRIDLPIMFRIQIAHESMGYLLMILTIRLTFILVTMMIMMLYCPLLLLRFFFLSYPTVRLLQVFFG